MIKDNVFIHPTTFVGDNVDIGNGTKVLRFSQILDNAKIGEDCVVGSYVSIEKNVLIGNGCKIQNYVSIFRGVTLEDGVFCGPSCVFTNVKNPRAFIERKNEFKPTLVKKGATIGANSTIVCGVTIGEYSIVGAGALITKDVPPYAVVVDKNDWIKSTCRCGKVFSFPLRCTDCECMKKER